MTFHPESDDFSYTIFRKSSWNFEKSMLQLSNLEILGALGVFECVEYIFAFKNPIKTLLSWDFEAWFCRFPGKNSPSSGNRRMVKRCLNENGHPHPHTYIKKERNGMN